MQTLETSRLIFNHITADDAPFVQAMLNDDDFIHYVADRGVRTLEQAQAYICDKIAASYKEHGFGMAAVRLKSSGETIGMSLDSMIRLYPNLKFGKAGVERKRGLTPFTNPLYILLNIFCG